MEVDAAAETAAARPAGLQFLFCFVFLSQNLRTAPTSTLLAHVSWATFEWDEVGYFFMHILTTQAE